MAQYPNDNDGNALLALIALADENATRQLGSVLAACLRPLDVIALSGGLGAGKTTLVRAILHALGHAGEVPSPTFTLVQLYDLPLGGVAHVDLYRIADEGELQELGLDELLQTHLCLIEWPERAAASLPAECLTIRLAPGESDQARVAHFLGNPAWRRRLASLISGDG
ncbi:MAG: tRNA (adenosine(37)-N6)-threonylcarbamoyltransferase complex ATPase subunit type 1 TsaE [Alphaproteobacteria bacterium]|nr:tRNA (adenosine(37)-N6)-threonylcarbamoyltransferase complex ATPase subunit type 1 TsaE [Alphaproteobacteria bacterium]